MGEEVKPGIYKDIPFDTYQSWDFMSQSILKEPSQLHMKAAMSRERKQTRGMRIGSAIHTYLLEPMKFAEAHPVALPCCSKLKSGARKGQDCGNDSKYRTLDGWFCGTHKPDEAQEVQSRITPKEQEQIHELGTKILSHRIGRHIRKPGESELSLVAEIEGIMMKGRIDRIWSDPPVILDCKKIPLRGGSESSLRSTIRKYGYDLQAAMYRRLWFELNGTRPGYIWLFIEDEPPYDLIVRQADEDMLSIGTGKLLQAVNTWKHALDQGYYFGCGGADFGTSVAKISPDEWEVKAWGL